MCVRTRLSAARARVYVCTCMCSRAHPLIFVCIGYGTCINYANAYVHTHEYSYLHDPLLLNDKFYDVTRLMIMKVIGGRGWEKAPVAWEDSK